MSEWKEYVLAMDGGATKTHILIFHMYSTKLWLYEGGPANHEVLAGGLEELPLVLGRHIKAALQQARVGKDQIAYSVFGLAGDDLPYQHKAISSILDGLGIGPYTLVNDAFLPIFTQAWEGKGIGVINGTGFSVAGADCSGAHLQVGGFGGMSDDFGGGGWYAEQTAAAIYRSLYKGGKPTALVELVRSALAMEPEQDMMEQLSLGMLHRRREIQKQLCMCMHAAANGGDEAAIDILERSAMEYAIAIRSMLQQGDFGALDEVPVVLCGTQFVKGSPLLRERLEALLPEECETVLLSDPPVLGALFEALRKQKFLITQDLHKKMAERLAKLLENA